MGALIPASFLVAVLAVAARGAAAQGAPPFPTAGQTVHWTAAMSPITLTSNQAIVWTGTVVVDPGVSVTLAGGTVLTVNGRLEAGPGSTLRAAAPARFDVAIQGALRVAGSPGNPAFLRGGGEYLTSAVSVAPYGVAELVHADSDVIVRGGANSLVTASDCTFRLSGVPNDYAGLNSQSGTLVVRRSTFLGARVDTNQAYVLVDDLVLDGGLLDLDRFRAGQPVWIDRVTARDRTSDAPFVLRGFDYAFGPSNSIHGNLYPVRLEGGGIAPGSVLPASGNLNDYVHAGTSETIGRTTFAAAGLDYRVDFDASFPELGARHAIEPGVTVRLGPGAYLWATGGASLVARGLPGAPITFTRFDPGLPWQTLSFGVNSTRPHLEHVVIDGAEIGIVADETPVTLSESLVTNCTVAGTHASNFGRTVVRKSRYVGNAVGARTSAGAPASGFGFGTADLAGATGGNAFEGNGVALQPLNGSANPDARDNWWGSSSGPTHASNPGGNGGLVQGVARVVPYRATPPDASNESPVVRMLPHSFLFEAGRRVILHWDASDDDAIVAQRLEYSPHGDALPLSLVTAIDPSRRSVEVLVPQPPPSSSLLPSVYRVTAVDAAGQESFDEIQFFTPLLDFTSGTVPQPVAGPMTPGQSFPLCWINLPGTSGTVDIAMFLDGDDWSYSLGGRTTAVTCLPASFFQAPPVSTDLARIGLRFNYGAGGRSRWDFTPYFAIRPDPRIGDAPPVVTLTSPIAGDAFHGGSIVPIAWTASDDEALRAFQVHASYDAGRTWHVVARGLPPDARQYAWRLCGSAGIPDLRVRVVATDLRYQNSSSGADRAFSILAGDEVGQPYCFGDGSGVACPCANFGDAGAGCANSVHPGGALLSASGVASVASDTVVLRGLGMPNSSVLYFQGTQSVGAAFGDGVRCAGGTVVRLGTRTNVGGASRLPDAGGTPISTLGGVTAPDTRYYQAWYRNGAAFCTTATYNLSNGVQITWGS